MTAYHRIPDIASDLAQPLAPPPWTLRGSGYLFALRFPDPMLDRSPWTPTSLRKSRRGPLSLAMLVNYEDSPVGRYGELLFIPGRFRFGSDLLPSISRILVSSQASVVAGRRNWGIPKDLAAFSLDLHGEGINQAHVREADGSLIADFVLQGRGPKLPINTALVPATWRQLGQVWEGREYRYAPSASGHVRRARVLDWQFAADRFPDLRQARLVSALQVTDFSMTFPAPRIRTLGSS